MNSSSEWERERDELLQALPEVEETTDMSEDDAETGEDQDAGEDGSTETMMASPPSATSTLVEAWKGDRDTLDVALESTPTEIHPALLRTAADDRLRSGRDDPAWLLIAALGQVEQLLHRHREEMEVAGRAAREAARAEIERTREETSSAIAEALAEAQQELARAAAREVAAMETSARTAVGQVVEDLRRRGAEAIEEMRRASPAHRTIWQRIWPPILSLTTAIAVGVGVGAGTYLWAAPPANAVLIQSADGRVWWAQQGQVLWSHPTNPDRKYIEIHPAELTMPRR